ncbi:MAG: metallophosphoesterase family protein [Anaerolineaceae bacterium]
MVRLIGDVHAKMKSYMEITKDVDHSIQVGDYGIGFIGPTQLVPDSFIQWQKDNPGHRFIRGNHDWPDGCRHCPNWIPDGKFERDWMFVGGAFSIDRDRRIEGLSWWRDEELNYATLDSLILKYQACAPRVMITHDCPYNVGVDLFEKTGRLIGNGKLNSTRTSLALDAMFSEHEPELWIFGHYHHDVDEVIGKTRFICLGELSYIDMNPHTLEIIKHPDWGYPKGYRGP